MYKKSKLFFQKWFCKLIVLHIQAQAKIMNYKLGLHRANSLCSQLGGAIPLPKSKTNFNLIFGNDLSLIMPQECKNLFWLPIARSKENQTNWADVRSLDQQLEVEYLPWAYGQPNGNLK